MDFLGKKCCKCNNILHADDDIVICPSCGAPYHRTCYESEGKCIFKDKHKIGFEWKFEDDETDEPLTKNCWRCGTANREDSMFCCNCGSMLNNNNSRTNNQNFGHNPNNYGMPFPDFTVQFDAMGGVPKDEDFGNDVNAAELAKLVKVNTPYYIREFKKIKDKKHLKFNFSSFIFSGFWMLYRRQYLWGAIITILLFALSIFSTYVNYNYNAEILNALNKQLSNNIGISYINYIQTAINNANNISAFRGFMMVLPYIITLVQLAIKIIIGLFGNKMYYKHCKNKIISIKSDTTIEQDKIDASISECGGIDFKILLLVSFCQIVVNLIITTFM